MGIYTSKVTINVEKVSCVQVLRPLVPKIRISSIDATVAPRRNRRCHLCLVAHARTSSRWSLAQSRVVCACFPVRSPSGNATYLIVRFHRHVWIHASCGRRRYLGHTPSRDFRRLGYCPAGQVLVVSGRTQLCLDCPYYVGNFFPLHVPRIDGRSLAISGFDAQ